MHAAPFRFLRIILRLSALVFLVTFPAVNASDKLTSGLETIREEEGLTGISWATVSPTGPTLGATGFADLQTNRKLTTEARMHVGSITKTVLATGILRLASEGKVDLYAPVQQYLPNLKFNNPWHTMSPVKVRHLMDHTAGLNGAFLWQIFSEQAAPDTPLSTAFTQEPAALDIRSRPGARLSYSNMGYSLLGMIIEAATGERYETYLNRELLVPLGMTNSSFRFTSQNEGEYFEPGLAWGHFDGGAKAASMPIYLRPAGQFTTTPSDMAKFLHFLMSDGQINGTSFIDANWMAARGRPWGTEAAASGLDAGYALGLSRIDRFGVIGYCHNGNIIGFVANMCIYPEDQKAFFYSVNTDSETANFRRLTEYFVNHLGPTAPTPARPDLMARDIREWEGFYILAPNRFASFEMLDILGGNMEATLKKGTFVLQSRAGQKTLHPTGDYLFSAEGQVDNTHIFMRSETGAYLISDGFRTYRKSNPALVYGIWASITLGAISILWILGVVAMAILRPKNKSLKHPLILPAIALVGLLLPVPLFFMQSYMTLGDMTPASLTLAAVTLALPFAALVSLLKIVNRKNRSTPDTIHGIACFGVLQVYGLLFYWGLMPLMLWTL